jgi:hypothetical protein
MTECGVKEENTNTEQRGYFRIGGHIKLLSILIAMNDGPVF